MVGCPKGHCHGHGFRSQGQDFRLILRRGEGLALPLFFLGGECMPIEDIVTCYVNIVNVALPVALVFGLGDLCVGTILRAAFGGRLTFRA